MAATSAVNWGSWPRLLLLWVVAAVMAYAGIIKIADPAQMLSDILNYRLFPRAVALLAALWIPWLELLGALALLLPRARPAGLAVLGGLLSVFTLALLSAWFRGLDITCGCFGKESTSVPFAIVRNMVLLSVLGWQAWWLRRSPRGLDATPAISHNA